MITIQDVKALREHEGDVVALIMSAAKVADLHEMIGKVRHLIGTLPDQDTVLQVDFDVQIYSLHRYAYQTNLKVGRLRTRIDAIRQEEGAMPIHFWPMWNDDEVVFDSLGSERIEEFVEQWNSKQTVDE